MNVNAVRPESKTQFTEDSFHQIIVTINPLNSPISPPHVHSTTKINLYNFPIFPDSQWFQIMTQHESFSVNNARCLLYI